MNPRIRAGEKVQWKSQAQGGVKQKSGTVIAFVPVMADARRLAPAAFAEGRRAQRQFDLASAAVARYVVEVPRVHARTGKQLHPFYYAPLASVLESQNPDALRTG